MLDFVAPLVASVAQFACLLALLVVVGVIGFNVVTFGVAFVLRPGRRPPSLARAFVNESLASLVLIPLYPLFAFIGEKYEEKAEGVDPDPRCEVS